MRLVRGEGMADQPLETASAAGAHPSRPNLRGRVLSAPDGQTRNQRNRACRAGPVPTRYVTATSAAHPDNVTWHGREVVATHVAGYPFPRRVFIRPGGAIRLLLFAWSRSSP